MPGLGHTLRMQLIKPYQGHSPSPTVTVTANHLNCDSISRSTYQRGCASLCLAARDVLDVERDDRFNLALEYRLCGPAKTEDVLTRGLVSATLAVQSRALSPQNELVRAEGEV